MTDQDSVATGISFAGVFAYLMKFQPEITVLVLLTGLLLNVIRIVDRVRKGKKED